MKLTPHQEEIVEAIIEQKVYDIPSYLNHFGKAHLQQYDFNLIQAKFDECENGQTYMFRKGNDSFYYTDTFDCNGHFIKSQQVPNRTTYEFVEHPIKTPVKAQLIKHVDREIVDYKGKRYSFDFLLNSHLVADSFDEIIDFITLWSYLKREALILEVDKDVSECDLSIFFHQVPKKISPNTNPQWSTHYEILSDINDPEFTDTQELLYPDKCAKHYIEQEWNLNKENFLTCFNYIDKKIIASTELRIYRSNNFKTYEQISQEKNLFVAWVAVGISVLSVFIGNILPLTQPQATDYLSDINQQITEIHTSIDTAVSNEEVLSELQSISSSLSEISSVQLSEEKLTVLEELQIQLEKLNETLSGNNFD